MEQDICKRVLVVGAGGFVGGFIVQEALRRGLEVWAGVRASTSRAFLGDERIRFAVFNFDDEQAVRNVLTQSPRWDYIVYNLGATKALHYADFLRINHDYLQTFLAALQATDHVPERLLFISSLSVMGPGDERNYAPFTSRSLPAPNTRYGASKLKAEVTLQASGIPYTIFRCTGIYGPRERDYFLMFKSVKSGVDFSVGYRRQMLTFIYVEDLARAVFQALESPQAAGKVYIISEDRAYTQAEFRALTARALGKKHVLPVVAPIWVLRGVCAVSGLIGKMRGRAMTLNPDKFRIMRQRNWTADISDARRDFGFEPATSLQQGIQRSIDWYRQAGWL